MKLISADIEENLYWRKQAQTWMHSGFMTESQLLELETMLPVPVRRTNVFMRFLLGGFTLVCLMSVVGFIYWVLKPKEQPWISLLLLSCAIPAYVLAEVIVKKIKFYRHGIEEGLALGALFLFCLSFMLQLSQWHVDNSQSTVLVCLVACVALLGVTLRFGWLYTAIAALISLSLIPLELHLTHFSERFLLLGIFIGLFVLITLMNRRTTYHYQKAWNGFLQTVLLLGMYLAVNLQLQTAWFFHYGSWKEHNGILNGIAYWVTYFLCWIHPCVVILLGQQTKQRSFIDVGLITLGITLATNKDYLDLPHKSWDPILFGFLLIVLATILNKLLSYKKQVATLGLTNENVLKPKTYGFDLAAAGVAFLHPTPSTSSSVPAPTMGGGSSGGGGASGGF